jgi:anti-sigma factor ChrR (cupin superfamily)
MSERLQSGLHLDAEILNAFAEGALPAHKREQALAHLAVCADCREIVFLAEQAQPVPAADSASRVDAGSAGYVPRPCSALELARQPWRGALIFALTLRTHRAAAAHGRASDSERAPAHTRLCNLSRHLPKSHRRRGRCASTPRRSMLWSHRRCTSRSLSRRPWIAGAASR